MYLAKNIKYLRQKNGLSLRQLGSACMIDPTHLSRIENDSIRVKSTSIYKVAKLAAYFEISIDALVYTDLSNEHMSPSDRRGVEDGYN